MLNTFHTVCFSSISFRLNDYLYSFSTLHIIFVYLAFFLGVCLSNLCAVGYNFMLFFLICLAMFCCLWFYWDSTFKFIFFTWVFGIIWVMYVPDTGHI